MLQVWGGRLHLYLLLLNNYFFLMFKIFGKVSIKFYFRIIMQNFRRNKFSLFAKFKAPNSKKTSFSLFKIFGSLLLKEKYPLCFFFCFNSNKHNSEVCKGHGIS